MRISRWHFDQAEYAATKSLHRGGLTPTTEQVEDITAVALVIGLREPQYLESHALAKQVKRRLKRLKRDDGTTKYNWLQRWLLEKLIEHVVRVIIEYILRNRDELAANPGDRSYCLPDV